MPFPTKYDTKVAVPLPSDDDYRRVTGMAYEPRKTLNVVKMLAGTEDMFKPTVGLIEAVFAAKGIDPKLRQMIILRAAKVLGAPYEAQANVPMSRNNGLTSAEIEAASSEGPVSGVATEYVLVCTAVDELSEKGTLTDDTLRAMLDRFGDTTIRKLVLIIGWFNLLSLFLNGCRVPMETEDKIGAMKTPLG